MKKLIVNFCQQKQLVHGCEAFSNHDLYLRHAELGSASYFLAAVGIKILKQVQDDGGCFLDERGVLG